MAKKATKTNTALFTAMGALHLLFALVLLLGVCAAIAALTSLGIGNQMLEQASQVAIALPTATETFVALGLGMVGLILYSVSAFGFFTMKKWQPTVYMVVVIFSALQLVYNVLTTGFEIQNFFTFAFLILWVYVLAIVQKRKDEFVN